MRRWAEVGVDRRGQDLLVGRVRQEVGAAAEDRPPPHLYPVQATRANTDLLVQRGGQPLRPEVWRLHHMPVAVDNLIGAFHGCAPPLPSRPSAGPLTRPWASVPPSAPAAGHRTVLGSPTGASA